VKRLPRPSAAPVSLTGVMTPPPRQDIRFCRWPHPRTGR
jgi:hypothetical protein